MIKSFNNEYEETVVLNDESKKKETVSGSDYFIN